jgi:acyl CoA:acetate/3-ketoacid CoA transferase
VDVEREVRAQVGFALRVSPQLRTMDARIFADEPMRLREQFSDAQLLSRTINS